MNQVSYSIVIYSILRNHIESTPMLSQKYSAYVHVPQVIIKRIVILFITDIVRLMPHL